MLSYEIKSNQLEKHIYYVVIKEKNLTTKYGCEYFHINDIQVAVYLSKKELINLSKKYDAWITDRICFHSRQKTLKFIREELYPLILSRKLTNETIEQDINKKIDEELEGF